MKNQQTISFKYKLKKIRRKLRKAVGLGEYTNALDKTGVTAGLMKVWVMFLGWCCLKRCMVKGPIFVVGSPHSGTSIMLKILSNHPSIYAVPGESGIFFKNFAVRTLMITAWYRLTCREGRLRWAEKTPSHLHKIGNIFSYFPDARVIGMVRDGRDVACSLKARFGDFEKGLDTWVEDNEAFEKFLSDPRVIRLRYEDLVKETDSALEQVFAFLDESYLHDVKDTSTVKSQWYSDVQEKPESAENTKHEQHRNWQINQPLFDGSDRWKTDMNNEERQLFKQHAAAQLLQYLGYIPEQDW